MSRSEILSPEGLRLDGRRPGEIRRLRCQMSAEPKADGSAYLEQGNTKGLVTGCGRGTFLQLVELVEKLAVRMLNPADMKASCGLASARASPSSPPRISRRCRPTSRRATCSRRTPTATYAAACEAPTAPKTF